ncbi:MAG: hypothetical protein O7B35_08445 [Deltaproteobacteria bacterium]|nr:hypothetical protein [Deltaproteobacteria bacterium]
MRFWSKNSGFFVGVLIQRFTQSFTSTNRLRLQAFLARRRDQELMASALMMAFLLV